MVMLGKDRCRPSLELAGGPGCPDAKSTGNAKHVGEAFGSVSLWDGLSWE